MNGIARTVSAPTGILTVHVSDGHAWDAVRALREGIQELRSSGTTPTMSFLYGIDVDGSLTSLGRASLIVLGYDA